LFGENLNFKILIDYGMLTIYVPDRNQPKAEGLSRKFVDYFMAHADKLKKLPQIN